MGCSSTFSFDSHTITPPLQARRIDDDAKPSLLLPLYRTLIHLGSDGRLHLKDSHIREGLCSCVHRGTPSTRDTNRERDRTKGERCQPPWILRASRPGVRRPPHYRNFNYPLLEKFPVCQNLCLQRYRYPRLFRTLPLPTAF